MKARLILLAVLFLAPFLFLMGVGTYHLYATGWSFIASLPMAASLLLAYGLSWYWTRRKYKGLLPDHSEAPPPDYWTDRDNDAWKLVRAKIAAAKAPKTSELADVRRYSDEAFEMALDVAKVYVPGAVDPVQHLTLPEILTAAELVAEDLSRRVAEYAIGSHLLTIGQMQTVKKYADIGQRAWNYAWLPRIALNPITAGTQFIASKAGGSVLSRVQGNLLAWFHQAYLTELGRNLIELNSGRLKVGAKRYRELVAAKQTPPTSGGGPMAISVVIVGMVKAGKSSLVNALLGEDRAKVAVTPLTADANVYEMTHGDLPKLKLIDTPGYGEDGPTAEEFKIAFDSAAKSDLLIFVTPARSAARKADKDFLDKLSASFASQPHLKKPPILVAMSHADLLTPAAEWAPPYDWHRGTRSKEATMRDAAEAATEQLGETAIVPVCALPERLWNVQEELLPMMAELIPGARGAAVLRLFHEESTSGKAVKAVEQVLNVGREAVRALFGGR